MDAATFLENFGTIADSPGGIASLRSLILDLAVRGKLVEQNEAEADASGLVSGFKDAESRMVDEGLINRPRFQRGEKISMLPHGVPKQWQWVLLGDVCAVVGGGTPSTKDSSLWAGSNSVPWVTPADMRGQATKYVTRGSRDISPKGLANSSAQLLPAGTVLFSSRAPIGHVGIAAQPISTNQGFKSCVPYEMEMSEYIYIFLKKAGPEIDAMATGTTFKEVSGKQVSLVPFPLPPLAEQKRIVAKVDELMSLCDELEAQQKLRDTLRTQARSSAIDAISTASSPEELGAAWERIHNNWNTIADTPESIASLRSLILDLAVRGKLVEQDSQDDGPVVDWDIEKLKLNEQKIWGHQYVAAIPRSWSCVPLARVGAWGSGGTPTRGNKSYYGGDIPWLVIGDLNDGLVTSAENAITQKGLSESSASIVPIGAVFVAMYGSIGKAGIAGIECATNQAIAHCVPDETLISTEYLFRLVLGIRRRLFSQGRGLAQQNISQTVLKHLLIPLPPLAEQKRIVAKVDELMSLCDELELALVERRDLSVRLARSGTRLAGSEAK